MPLGCQGRIWPASGPKASGPGAQTARPSRPWPPPGPWRGGQAQAHARLQESCQARHDAVSSPWGCILRASWCHCTAACSRQASSSDGSSCGLTAARPASAGRGRMIPMICHMFDQVGSPGPGGPLRSSGVAAFCCTCSSCCSRRSSSGRSGPGLGACSQALTWLEQLLEGLGDLQRHLGRLGLTSCTRPARNAHPAPFAL